MTDSPLPLVSAIIPVFNRPEQIRRAADSVLAQDYRPLELILVDDGSTDATPRALQEIVSHAAGGPIAVRLLQQENQGVAAARNHAIRQAQGEWIALLDSDDEWLPQKTSLQVRHLLDGPSPAALISQTDEVWIRGGRRVNRPKRLAKSSGDLFEASLDHCAISPSAVMMHRRLLDEVGLFDETYPACEDYEMWLRVSSRHQVALLPEPLIVKYGGHADQLSRSIKALDRHRIRAIVKTLENTILSAAQRALALQALETKCLIYAQGCEKRGRAEEAREIRALPKSL